MAIILALGRLRQKIMGLRQSRLHYKFKGSLCYTVIFCPKQNQNQNRNNHQTGTLKLEGPTSLHPRQEGGLDNSI